MEIFVLPENWLETSVRLISAAAMAALIGLEREVRDKPAGLRTHMLVGLGAAAFTVFGIDLATGLGHQNESFSFDPLRIVSGVIGGLGFLGAGAIIQSRGDVFGLTTAAGIWLVGAIGVGCGTGNYFAVGITTLIALICLVPVRHIEHNLSISIPTETVSPSESNSDDT